MNIHWTDGGAISHRDAQAYRQAILQRMHGLTPLHGVERRQLREYATERGLSPRLLYSMRAGVRISEEMASHRRAPSTEAILRMFSKITSYPPETHRRRLRHLLASQPIPYGRAYQAIHESPEWQTLSREGQAYLDRLAAVDNPTRRARIAEAYERKVGDWLYDQGVSHQTEDDIRESNPEAPTPDYLFDEPLTIIRAGREHVIHWMDAKDYFLARSSWPERPLRRQAARYTKAYGTGAFISSVGYDTSLRIPDTLILDSVSMI